MQPRISQLGLVDIRRLKCSLNELERLLESNELKDETNYKKVILQPYALKSVD